MRNGASGTATIHWLDISRGDCYGWPKTVMIVSPSFRVNGVPEDVAGLPIPDALLKCGNDNVVAPN